MWVLLRCPSVYLDLSLWYLESVVAEGLGARQAVHSTQGAHNQQTGLPHTLKNYSHPQLHVCTASS